MNDNDDEWAWFDAALEDAEMEVGKRRLMGKQPPYYSKVLPPVKPTPTLAEVSAALEEMDRVARGGAMMTSGAIDVNGRILDGSTPSKPVNKPKPISPKVGMKAILEHIQRQKDPRKAASEWLVKFSNEIYELTKELDDDEDHP